MNSFSKDDLYYLSKDKWSSFFKNKEVEVTMPKIISGKVKELLVSSDKDALPYGFVLEDGREVGVLVSDCVVKVM